MIFQLFGYGTATEIIASIIGCGAALLIAITLHEFAHAFVAYKCGDITPKLAGRVSINPARHLDWIGTILLFVAGFGFAKPVPINPTNFKHQKRSMAFVSLAGVITNLILAFVFALLYLVCSKYLLAYNFFSILLIQFLLYSCVYNVSLCVFNLIPIYPLDGYNFIMSFVSKREKIDNFMRSYGFFILIIVIVFCSNLIFACDMYIINAFIKLWKLIFGGLL